MPSRVEHREITTMVVTRYSLNSYRFVTFVSDNYENSMYRTALFLLLATTVFAQTDTSILTGLVTDPSGAAVSGAAIQLRSAATAAVRSTVSATDGRYQFSLVPPGEYEVTAEAAGFKKFSAEGIH